MSASDDHSATDSFWEDVKPDDAEISTTVFVAIIILLAFSIDVIGFRWAVIAMLGLIAAAGSTE